MIHAKSKYNSVNKSYAVFDFCIAFYAFFYFLWQSTANTSNQILYFKLCIFGVVLINTSFVNFVIQLLDLQNSHKRHLITTHVINTFYAIAALGLFYKDWKYNNYGFWPIPSNVFNTYLIWWFLQVIYCFYLIGKFGVTRNGIEKTKFQWIFWSTLIAYTGGATNWLVWYGINFPPYLNSGIAIYALVLAYAIFKHDVLNMEMIIKRTLVFSGLFLITYSSFIGLSYLSKYYIGMALSLPGWMSAIPVVLIIVVFLKPTEEMLISLTNKYLFQKPYDYKELLKIFTDEVLTVLDLEKVSKNTVEGLDNIIRLESCAVLLKDESGEEFKVCASRNLSPSLFKLKVTSELIKKVCREKDIVKKSQLERDSAIFFKLKQEFENLKAEIIIPIIYSREVIGLISLGRKKSGYDFNKEDIDILKSLAGTEGIAVYNAKLYTQLSQTQAEAAQSEKMAVIGTLASGINHEICNPLGIVRGHCEVFLLNFKDGLYKNIDKDKLLDQVTKTYEKIITQIDRATGITKRLSAFAKPNKLFKKEPIDAGHEVEEVLQILAHEMRIHNIEVKNELPTNYPKIMCDKKQIQEVMFNIIRNAAQAMKGNGRIQIDGARNGVRAWINIKDTGPGITPEQQAKIFHPFFTTKQPGEGTGLGLYIVKQIVEKNDGTIELSSVPGEGATFKLTFKIAEEECLKS